MAVERLNRVIDDLISEMNPAHPDFAYLQRVKNSNALYMGSAKREQDLQDIEKRRLVAATFEERTRFIENILPVVSEVFGQPVEDILYGGREKFLVQARVAASYLYSTVGDLGPSEIARRMGGKDHSTIINHLTRAEGFLKENTLFSESIFQAEDKLRELTSNAKPQA